MPPQLCIINRKEMMNTMNTAARFNPAVLETTCSCTNQHLLAPGSVCDICMGLVAEPVATAQASTDEDSRFDQQYFEALESYYVDVDFAA